MSLFFLFSFIVQKDCISFLYKSRWADVPNGYGQISRISTDFNPVVPATYLIRRLLLVKNPESCQIFTLSIGIVLNAKDYRYFYSKVSISN